MLETTEGFAGYDACTQVGVFTCRCPGDNVADMAKILKSKGAQAIHLCTCTFASKTEEGWDKTKGGFCPNIEKIAADISRASGLTCILGTAHLPKDYSPVTFE
jgi:predicted metal-binding protein